MPLSPSETVLAAEESLEEESLEDTFVHPNRYYLRSQTVHKIKVYVEVEGNAYFLSFKDKSNDDVRILRSVA